MTEIISFSLPKGMLEKLDIQRGDIARSKFLSRILETALNLNQMATDNLKVKGAPGTNQASLNLANTLLASNLSLVRRVSSGT